jgi:uncharacterized membrane protein YhaH (DUF805 family)
MSFSDAVRTCLHKYADFSGRGRRSEYWFFYLAYLIAYAVAGLLTSVVWKGFAVLALVVVLGAIVPALAVTWRRLHDTGRSGGWFFISFVPLVGWIILLVFMIQDSNPGPNQFGPNPKDPQAITG